MSTRPPMPGTCHPDLERYATGIRAAVKARPWGPIVVEWVTEAQHWEDGITFHRHLLQVQQARARAPYTEARAYYEWDVLTDPEGRTVTTEARLVVDPKLPVEVWQHGGNV